MEGDFTMVYGYARVSTKGQAKDGNSLEAQGKALKESVLWRFLWMHFQVRKQIDQNLINF